MKTTLNIGNINTTNLLLLLTLNKKGVLRCYSSLKQMSMVRRQKKKKIVWSFYYLISWFVGKVLGLQKVKLVATKINVNLIKYVKL